MTVIFFTPGPREDASCRMRVAQYLPWLEHAGIRGVIRPFMHPAFFRMAYQPGRAWRKAAYVVVRFGYRLWNCVECLRADAIYILRECAPVGPPVIEWLLMCTGKPIIYDMDDAVYMPSGQEQLQGRIGRWLKWYGKIDWLLRHASHVVVGNQHLKQHANQFTDRVTVLPTPEDPARFSASGSGGSNGRLTIGWIGTHSTTPYLLQLRDVFQALSSRYDFELKVIGAGRPVEFPGVRVANLRWSLSEEARQVQSFDIGVYPLSGSEFDRGKACYKAILYMAAGVPVIGSGFGANCEIIQDGINGLLSRTKEEWMARLGELIEQPALRARLASAGRQAVAERYAVAVTAPMLIEILRRVAAERTRTVAS